MGRLSEDLSEERGTGLKKDKYIKWVIFYMKTVYIGKQGYDNKYTHILLVKLTKTLIYVNKERLYYLKELSLI